MPYRAPKAHRHAHIGGHVRHVLVFKTIGQVKQAFGRGFVGQVYGAGQQGHGALHPARRNGVASRLDAQALHLALGIERGFEAGGVHGAVKVVAHVFFARPRQLHRLAARGQGHFDGLGNKVHLKPAAKATAQEGDVHHHFVYVHTCGLGGSGASGRRDLRRRPDFDLAVFDLRGAVHGLHGGVRQIGRGIAGFNRLAAGFFGGGNVALLKKGEAALFVELALQGGGNLLRVQSALGALLPLRGDGLGALAGVPSGFCHHGKTGAGAMQRVQRHHLLHAGQGQGGFAVERRGAAANHGRQAHGGKQHVGQAHIQAKSGAAIGFAHQIGARGGCANQLPVLALFGRHGARRRAGTGLGKFAVVARFARGVLQLALLHGDLGHRYFPLRSRSAKQAGARSGRSHAQGLPTVRHAGRAARGDDAQFAPELAHNPLAHFHGRGLGATFRGQWMKRQAAQKHGHVAVNGVGPGLFQPHLRQRHVELFGHQHGQGGVHALAHFAARHGQHHGAVLGDLDPAVQCHLVLGGQHVVGLAKARARGHHAPAHDEGAGGAQGAQYPGAALHTVTSTALDARLVACAMAIWGAPAARWMAARTRW